MVRKRIYRTRKLKYKSKSKSRTTKKKRRYTRKGLATRTAQQTKGFIKEHHKALLTGALALPIAYHLGQKQKVATPTTQYQAHLAKFGLYKQPELYNYQIYTGKAKHKLSQLKNKGMSIYRKNKFLLP